MVLMLGVAPFERMNWMADVPTCITSALISWMKYVQIMSYDYIHNELNMLHELDKELMRELDTNLDVVPVAGLLSARGGGGGRGRVRVGQQEVVPQLAQEADRRPVLEVAVQVL